MTPLPDPRHRTTDAVFRAIERDAREWRRPHMGASQLGKECERELWYAFRWIQRPELSGRLLALFERGEREESVQFARMRAAGLQVWTRDPETGDQFDVNLAPHIGGSIDGVVLGLLEAPKTPHVVDVKTASKKRFDQLLRVGLREWSTDYWSQLQLYMHDRRWHLDRGLLWVVCKDDDRLYMERIRRDKDAAERLVEKGRRVVHASIPPTRISEDSSWYECKMCNFHSTCQLGQIEKLERNCRSCVSSTPQAKGPPWWRCDHHQKDLTLEDQRTGCADHLLHPGIMPRGWRVAEGCDEARFVRYEDQGQLYEDREMEIKPCETT